MASRKLIQLLESLREATLGQLVHWSESTSESAFQVVLGGNRVEIGEDDGDINPGYVVSLKNSDGKTIDVEFFNDQLNSESLETVRSLYELARKDASGVDSIIESMIQAIPRSR